MKKIIKFQNFRIMRHIIKFMLFSALGAMIFVSCEEDKFTEKDAMDALQHIDVALTVQDGSSMGSTVEGATVKLVTDSTSSGSGTEKTTDGSGSVVFSDVKVGGSMNVYVNKDNYTKALFTISTSSDSYRTSQISKTLTIYSLSGDNMATVKGQLTLQSDFTNRKVEKLAGKQIRVINNDLEGNNERSFIGTTDSEGKYSVQVPVNGTGDDDLEVKFPNQIDTTQTLAVDSAKEVVSKPAVYYADNYQPSNIPFVPSATVSVDAPETVEGTGSGFDLGSEPVAVDFSYASNEIGTINRSGSGYHVANGTSYGDTTLFISEGIHGDSTKINVKVNKVSNSSDSSSIESINVNVDNGKYKSKPFTASDVEDLVSNLGGSGLNVELVRWENPYKIYVESYGSDYKDYPEIDIKSWRYDGDEIVQGFYPNFNMSNLLEIIDGKIYPSESSYNGEMNDTLEVVGGFTQAFEFTITTKEVIGEQAVVEVPYSDINSSDSTITSYSIDVDGSHYDPANPPEITVNSRAGYGSGADFIAEVNAGGALDNIEINDEGEGYVRNVNDYVNSGIQNIFTWHDPNQPGRGQGFTIQGDTYIQGVGAGDEYTTNIYYGTGKRKE